MIGFRYHSRRYDLNEKFFDSWSSTMAYVLGFWFADGYMRTEKSYRIQFSSCDHDILEAIKLAMSSTHPIRKSKKDNTWELILFSKHLFKALQKRGGLRRKSRVVTFPKIPPRYLRDFIRGYFDGDGSVFQVRYIATKTQRMTTELRSNFTSGSRVFLEELMNVLQRSIGLKKKVLGSFNDGHSLKLGYGIKETTRLLNFLYYTSCPIALARKMRFFNKHKGSESY